MNRLLLLPVVFLLAACGSQPPRPVSSPGVAPPPPLVSAGGRGGYYQDDGPAAAIPVDLAGVPDAVPRDEPLHRYANRPYNVLGRDYVPFTVRAPFRQQGVASWYGRKFHGQKTSSGEPYDMFAMTAAHPTLPIPSYARVTRPDTGKSVIVRVNDRGPFLHERIIDLSYAAAWKLGISGKGSGAVIVESVLPGEAPPPAPLLVAAAETPAPGPLPAAAPAVAQAPEALRDIEERGGHYLQLGAFGNRDNAESLQGRLALTLGEFADKLLIRSAGSIHRVQLGPWPDAASAARIAAQLRTVFDLPSVLVK